MRIIECLDVLYPKNNSDYTKDKKNNKLTAKTEEEQRVIDSVHALLYKYKNINRVDVLLKSLLDDKTQDSK